MGTGFRRLALAKTEAEMSDCVEAKRNLGKKAILAFKNETLDHINALGLDSLRPARSKLQSCYLRIPVLIGYRIVMVIRMRCA